MRTLKDQIKVCKRAQYAVGGAVLLSLLGFWLGGYRPMTAKLRELQAQTRSKEADLRNNQSKARILPQVAVEVRKLRQQLDQLKRPSKQQELPTLIKDLTQLGQQASLRKFSYKPGVAGRNDLFSELPLAITFEGDFVNVFNFLRNTEEMQRLTRVKSIKLTSKDKTNGQVQAQVSLNIYFSAE